MPLVGRTKQDQSPAGLEAITGTVKEKVEAQLELRSQGAQRKRDRKKYWQSLDIHISHPTRSACSLYFIEPLCAGGTAWQPSSFNGKYGPLLPFRLSLRYHSCFLSIPSDIILSRLCNGVFFPSPSLFLSWPFLRFYWCSMFHPSCFTPHFYPSSCRPLNPLSFAPFCPGPRPVFSLLEWSPRIIPFPLALSVFLVFPDSFPPGHSFLCSYLCHRISSSLFTLWLCHLHLTFF